MPVPDEIARVLAAGGRWTTFEHHEVATSTNRLVTERAEAGASVGLVVVADHQTEGRGRQGRQWADRPGGSLLVSTLIATPTFSGLVPHAVGLALAEVITTYGLRPELRWPNDIDLGGRKCAGTLVELIGHRMVVGTGIDVDWRGEPRTGDAVDWTSLAEQRGADIDRWELLAGYLRALDRWLGRLEHEPDALLADYRAACTTLDREVTASLPGDRTITGHATSIGASGALVLTTADGEVTVSSGDVVRVSLDRPPPSPSGPAAV